MGEPDPPHETKHLGANGGRNSRIQVLAQKLIK